MAREITLNGQHEIAVVVKEEVLVNTDKISIDRVTDTGSVVYARLSFFDPIGMTRTLTLWEGQDYIDIGQWTDSDVENRIKQLLNVS